MTAPIVFGRLHLVPVLADFLRAYPDIDVRLTLSNRQVNLIEEGIDAALRVGDLPDSALIATRVGTICRVFAASPGYLEGRGIPQEPADLVGHDCIGVQGFTGSGFWSVASDVEIPVRYRLIVNSTDAACEAAKEGMGIVSVFSITSRRTSGTAPWFWSCRTSSGRRFRSAWSERRESICR